MSKYSFISYLPSWFAFQHLQHYPVDYRRKRVVLCNVLSFSLSPLTVAFYHHCQSFLKPGQLGTVLSKPQMAFECKPHEMQVAQGCSCRRTRRLNASLAITRCGHTLSLPPPPLHLTLARSFLLTLSLQFGAMSYQKWSREWGEMPALLRSLEQFINKRVCARVCSCVCECICPTQIAKVCLLYSYVRYAKTYLYSHNSVCGFQYEKENRNDITIAFSSLTNVSVFLFVWLFGLLFALICLSHLWYCKLWACHKVCLPCNKCLMKASQNAIKILLQAYFIFYASQIEIN